MGVITQDAIRELARFRSSEAPVVTCYLDVDGRRAAVRKSYEQELERLVRSCHDQADGADDPSGDLRRIEAYVKGGFDRSRTRGLAIFSCIGRDLWKVVPLPVSVHSRIVVNDAPAVGQLEAVVQGLDRIGILLVDKQRARLLVYQFGELLDRSELFDELPRDYDDRGDKDQGFERERQHLDELVTRHLRHVADTAFSVFRQQAFEHLTIGASDELRPEFESLLHPYLRDRLAPTAPIGVMATDADILSAVLVVEQQLEREKEQSLVSRLRDAVGAKRRGAAGLDETLRALNEHRVETLLVSQGYRETGWRCTTCGALQAVGPDCSMDLSPMTHCTDVVEEAIDTALAQSCPVEICVNNADLDVLGRIGALLRY